MKNRRGGLIRADMVDLVGVLTFAVLVLVRLILQHLDPRVTVTLRLGEMGHRVELGDLVLGEEDQEGERKRRRGKQEL